MKKAFVSTAFGLSMLAVAAVPAMAQGTIKIGYVDPLSGGGASTGEIGLNQLKFIAKRVNEKGGVLGKKIEIIPYDNKLSPQTSLIQVQKAIDDGVDIITQGNGSSVGIAIENFVNKYNARNPGKGVVYLNYAAIDPILTNKDCSYWHFAWDANVNIKVEALTNFIKQKKGIKKVYLINQDYDFGHSVADAAKKLLNKKRPDIKIVGDEFAPLQKVTDFSPYIAKIKASGADSVITSDWGQDLSLLIKAAGDAGLKANWYTFYAGLAGGATAIKQADLPNKVFQINEGINNLDYKPARETAKAFIDSHKSSPIFYPRMFNEMGMLFKAMREAKSTEPVKFVPKLEGMKYKTFSTGAVGFMRKKDHQFFQPLFISTLGPTGSSQPFDEEGTGWGWKKVAEVPTKDTIVSTTCKMKRPH